MKLFTISGLDGSGKSTQIERLKKYLASQNKKIFYFHSIEFGIAKKIINFRNKYCLICRLAGKCKTYKEKSIIRANFFQIMLRRFFLLIDIWRFDSLCKKLEREKFDYVLSDRYFYDSLINIYYLSGKDKRIPCERFIKKPDLAVYLQADPDIIMQRERKPDQGIEYLQEKKELYDKKFSFWNLKKINGNQDKEKIFNNLTEMIEKL